MIEIEESGMRFMVDEANLYHVETSDAYNSLKNKGLEICEFAELKGKRIILLEAKTSAPNPASPNADAAEKFDNYIKTNANKFVNAAIMLNAGVFKRNQEIGKEIPPTFTASILRDCRYNCVLVIKNHKVEWITSVQDALEREINRTPFCAIWKHFSVKVLNEEIARQQGFIK